MTENELLDFFAKYNGAMLCEDEHLSYAEEFEKNGFIKRVDRINPNLWNASYTYVVVGKEKEGLDYVYGKFSWPGNNEE